MIKLLISILKITLAILPFAILCLRSNKVNLDKTERSKQFLMPVVAIIYSFIAMFLMKELNELLIRLVNKIPGLIEYIAGLFHDEAEKNIMELAEKVRNFISSLNLVYWMFYISNAIILGIYLIIKRICLAIMKKSFELPQHCLSRTGSDGWNSHDIAADSLYHRDFRMRLA
ncbi:MAG: hypothetical protein Q4G23_09020, partial [Clostridia bacterium]|nr:hypothetical protein [Clostridia bacterium]